jgi:G3E family GTPase
VGSSAATFDRYDPCLDDRVPVTLLTGFLGSGKTTLLNRILTELSGERIAVIENEFGEVGIDHKLVLDAEQIFEMNRGCLCCTVQGDLTRVLRALAARPDHFDRILVETTGLADPAPVARTFFLDDAIRSRLRLDAIVTMVDALHGGEQLGEVKPVGVDNEAVEQVALADRIVINKSDLAGRAQMCELSAAIRAINPAAPIVTAQQAEVDLDLVLGLEAFDPSRVLHLHPRFGRRTHRHDESISSVGIDLDGEVDPDRVQRWLRELLADRAGDILRSKGVLALAGHHNGWVFQTVRALLDTKPGKPWSEGQPRHNRMVLIGRNLDRDELEQGFRACLQAAR